MNFSNEAIEKLGKIILRVTLRGQSPKGPVQSVARELLEPSVLEGETPEQYTARTGIKLGMTTDHEGKFKNT